MTRRPKLGLHCPGTGTGGPWRYVHSLLQHLDLDEFDVSVFCDIEGAYAPRPAVKVVPLSHPSLFGRGGGRVEGSTLPPPLPKREGRKNYFPQPLRVLAGFARSARHLARVLAPHRLDLFHTQNTGCEEAPVAARLAGIPRIVGTFHTDSSYDLHRERDGLHYRILERLSNRSLHRAIAVSHATGRDWRRRTFLPSRRIVTIHNGIDASRFHRQRSKADARRELGLPSEVYVIAGVGRLEEAKGFADLIDAVALAELPKAMIALAGEGPLRPTLEAQAASKNVTLTCLGFLSDVRLLLDAADVFALPSLCEACPYAVLEAMAAGLTVLASDVGGVRELVSPECGIVLPPRQPQAWADALGTNWPSLTVGPRPSDAARFDEATMVEKTLRVYRELLSRGPTVRKGSTALPDGPAS